MKKIIFILLFFCVSSIGYSQDTIVTAQGFEYTYYFNGNSWSQFNKSGTKLSMNLFVTNKDEKSLWLQNVSLRETELKKLMNYLDTMPRLACWCKLL